LQKSAYFFALWWQNNQHHLSKRGVEMEQTGIAGAGLLALMPGHEPCKAGHGYQTVVWDGKCRLPRGLRVHTLIQPGEAGDSGIAAVQVITCGGYHGDTLTVSSAMEGGMASLQRQVLRIDGSVCTPCEVPLGSFSGDLQQRLLLAALALRQGRLREV
jgi:hypothetical protein